jgi:hypothetical protein
MLQRQERKEHMHWQSNKRKKGKDKNIKTYTQNPPTGWGEDIVTSKMCRKPWMACVRFLECMGFAPGMLHRSTINSHVKTRPTDLSTVFGWYQQCQIISTCASDDSGSWNPLHKPWISVSSKRMTKHARWRHTLSTNRPKHLPMVQVIPGSHAGVLCMGMEHAGSPSFSIKLYPRRKHLSIRLSLKSESESEVNPGKQAVSACNVASVSSTLNVRGSQFAWR